MKKQLIHIKKSNEGKFTNYCNGKVTESCIKKAKASGNAKLIKRATFAENARKWKHQSGGIIMIPKHGKGNILIKLGHWIGDTVSDAAEQVSQGNDILSRKVITPLTSTYKTYTEADLDEIKAYNDKHPDNPVKVGDIKRDISTGKKIVDLKGLSSLEFFKNNANDIKNDVTSAISSIKKTKEEILNDSLKSLNVLLENRIKTSEAADEAFKKLLDTATNNVYDTNLEINMNGIHSDVNLARSGMTDIYKSDLDLNKTLLEKSNTKLKELETLEEKDKATIKEEKQQLDLLEYYKAMLKIASEKLGNSTGDKVTNGAPSEGTIDTSTENEVDGATDDSTMKLGDSNDPELTNPLSEKYKSANWIFDDIANIWKKPAAVNKSGGMLNFIKYLRKFK